MKKILFRKLLFDCLIFFVITLFSTGVIIWVFQAVNFLDIIVEDGRNYLVYLNFSFDIFHFWKRKQRRSIGCSNLRKYTWWRKKFRWIQQRWIWRIYRRWWQLWWRRCQRRMVICNYFLLNVTSSFSII